MAKKTTKKNPCKNNPYSRAGSNFMKVEAKDCKDDPLNCAERLSNHYCNIYAQDSLNQQQNFEDCKCGVKKKSNQLKK